MFTLKNKVEIIRKNAKQDARNVRYSSTISDLSCHPDILSTRKYVVSPTTFSSIIFTVSTAIGQSSLSLEGLEHDVAPKTDTESYAILSKNRKLKYCI